MKNIFFFIIVNCSLLIGHCYSQWIQQNSGTTGDLNSVYFVNSLTGWVCGVTGPVSTDRIAKTTDGGITWVRQNAGTFYVLNSIQFINDQTGWAAGIHGTVVKTTNGGANWNLVLELGTFDWNTIQFIDINTGWVSGNSDQIYKSTDGGLNWQAFPGNIAGIKFHFTDINTGYSIASSFNGKINKSTNSGLNWIQSNFNSQSLTSIFFLNTTTGWVAGSDANIPSNSITMNTTNGGINWNTSVLGTFLALRDIFFININKGWVTSFSGKVYITTNSGSNWSSQVTNINTELKDIYFLDSLYGWSVGEGGVILKTTNGGGPLGINIINTEIPLNFNLDQNYPNPFNPNTKIRFNIGNSGHIILRVFDLQGKYLETLINQKLQLGEYEIEWQGNNYASGIYFYRIEAGNFVESKKMLMIK